MTSPTKNPKPKTYNFLVETRRLPESIEGLTSSSDCRVMARNVQASIVAGTGVSLRNLRIQLGLVTI